MFLTSLVWHVWSKRTLKFADFMLTCCN